MEHCRPGTGACCSNWLVAVGLPIVASPSSPFTVDQFVGVVYCSTSPCAKCRILRDFSRSERDSAASPISSALRRGFLGNATNPQSFELLPGCAAAICVATAPVSTAVSRDRVDVSSLSTSWCERYSCLQRAAQTAGDREQMLLNRFFSGCSRRGRSSRSRASGATPRRCRQGSGGSDLRLNLRFQPLRAHRRVRARCNKTRPRST